MADDSNGNGQRRSANILGQWALGIVSIAAVGAISFVSGKVFEHESRLSRKEEQLTRIIEMSTAAKQQSDIAIGVAEQHGEEFLEMRKQITAVKNQIDTSVKLINHQMQLATDDRFRRTEWLAEKKLNEAKHEQIVQWLQSMQRTIDELPPDEWEDRIRALEKFHNDGGSEPLSQE